MTKQHAIEEIKYAMKMNNWDKIEDIGNGAFLRPTFDYGNLCGYIHDLIVTFGILDEDLK